MRKRTTPDAGTVQHKYDRAGNVRYTQNANQAAAGQVYFTSYDFAHRPLTSGQTLALGDRAGHGATEATTTAMAYNVLGNRTQVTDPRTLISRDSVDTRGLLRKRTTPDAGTVQHKYDRAGNLRYTQDANQAAAGQVYFTSYDFAHRPLTSGQGAATFSSLDPDAAPQTFETTSANFLVVRQYDAKPNTGTVPWSYFSTQITPLTLPNVSGRLAAVASRSGSAWQVTLYGYTTTGQLTNRWTYTQNAAGSAVLTAVNTVETDTLDLQGNRTVRRLTVGTSAWNQWYEYDGAGRLWKVFGATTASKPASVDVTYTYRPSGAVQDRTLYSTGAGDDACSLRRALVQGGMLRVGSGAKQPSVRRCRPGGGVGVHLEKIHASHQARASRGRRLHSYSVE